MRVTMMAPTESQKQYIEKCGNTVFARLPALENRRAIAFFVKELTTEIAMALFQASLGIDSEIKIGGETYKFDTCGVDIDEIVIVPLGFASIAFRDVNCSQDNLPVSSSTDGSCPKYPDAFESYMAKCGQPA